MREKPPKFPFHLVRWICKQGYVEEIEGDMEERFHDNVEVYGRRRARQLYTRDVIKLFRLTLLKDLGGDLRLNHYGMFRHNLLISFRNFLRYKSTFLINLFGLASGLAASILIYLWVNDELTVDKFSEPDSHRHVQVIHSYNTSGTLHTNTNGSTPNPLYEALAKAMPEVAYSFPVKAHPSYHGIATVGDRHLRARYQFVGKGYFNVFPGDFILGDKHKILSDINEVAISKRLATSLFNSPESAIGQIVELKDPGYGGSYLVSGVFNPTHTSSSFDILFSYDLFKEQDLMQWYNSGTQAHLVLKQGIDLVEFNDKIRTFMTRVYKNSEDVLYAQPYAERYLYNRYQNGIPTGGRIAYVRLFSLIALVVLVIACINYMNFSTAKSARRIKEIGVKKAIGARRGTLILQYFGESVLMAFVSLIIASAMVFLLLPQFNLITGKELAISLEPKVLFSIFAITGLTGIVSGIYPALHLSGFGPVAALKGRVKLESQGLFVRKVLVVFQFTITAILIVSVVVIYQQVQYIQTKNLGYHKDHIITFPKEGRLQENFEPFLEEVRSISSVVNASQMYGELPGRISFSQGYKWEGMGAADKRLRFYRIQGGYDLIELLGIKMKAGRTFSKDFSMDKDAIILNQAAVTATGLKNPVGQKFGNYNPNAPTKEVIGVIENFHFQSLQEEVRPFFFSLSDRGNNFLVKIQEGTEKETLEQLEMLYLKFNEGYPFEYRFLDDSYQAIYTSESRISVLSKYFAVMAIAISCLGLLALTAFSIQGRSREIAIRKILGSSASQIVNLLSKDFMVLVFMAMLIALPISYYVLRTWLDGFAYRISLEPIYFILGGILMVSTAWLTILTQTTKSAQINVSESLRTND